MKSYVAGDCAFDPLRLYGWYGAQPPSCRSAFADSGAVSAGLLYET